MTKTIVCRSCLKVGDSNEQFKQLKNIAKEVVDLVYVNSLNSDCINGPVICHSCLECFKDHYNFITSCQDAERKIMFYLINTNTEPPIDLFYVLKFTLQAKMEANLNDFSCKYDNEKIVLENTEKDKNIIRFEEIILDRLKCEMDRTDVRNRKNTDSTIICQKNTRKRVKTITFFDCDVCAFKTKHKDYLSKHKLMHQAPETTVFFGCNECSFKTKYKDYLNKHKLIHKPLEETVFFECNICSFKTKHKRNLGTHKLIHRTPEETIFFDCDMCEFRTKHKEYLNKHKLNHTVTLLHECDVCGFKTKQKYNLETHKLVHRTPEETVFYRCEICEYKTKHKGSLSRHDLIHKAPDEAVLLHCDLCAFKSKHKRSLTRHKLTHTTVLLNRN